MPERRPPPRPVRIGGVSLVVVTDGGPAPALDALAALELPDGDHEVVVVGPTPPGGVGGAVGPVRFVERPPGSSVAAARNRGAARARGEHLAFLDATAQPDPAWIVAALARMRANCRAAAVASVLRDDDGDIVFAGATLDLATAVVPARARPVDAMPVLFAASAALVVEARAFQWVGGFDAEHCPGAEHVDLGWRLWLAGFEVWCEPTSIVTVDGTPLEGESVEAVGGRLTMLGKNLDDRRADVLVVAAQRALATSNPEATRVFAPAAVRAAAARADVQRRRRVPDTTVLRWIVGAAAPDVDVLAPPRPDLLVITPDVLGPKMAGPAIRALELARALASVCTVRVVSTVRCDLGPTDVPVAYADDAALRKAVDQADVLLVQGHVLDHHPWIRDARAAIVVDLYDPIHLEVLEHSRELPLLQRRRGVQFARDTIARQIDRGDFFLVASEKQRDFWIGHLALAGRVNATSYDGDPSLRSLIDVVPFGVPEGTPVPGTPVLRGVVPGIGADDPVILWAGGVYNWFDPLTLLRAVDRLRQRVPEVRLYFMGLRHPHPEVGEMAMARHTRALATELGLDGAHVFFNEGWVDYDRRQAYLLEADIGVSTHLDHLETAFSFRTRVLDYLWAALPIVATTGDGMAELIEHEGFGITVPPGDVDALEAALFALVSDPARRADARARIEAQRDRFRWARAAEPLARYCAQPYRAPDLVDPRETALHGDRAAAAYWGSGWRQSARNAISLLGRGEVDELSRKVRGRVASRRRSPEGE
jgi:glycosyltransferase involved in cell wall biosynthesis